MLNVFALHGVNAARAVQLRQTKVACTNLNELVTALRACTIGIEVCSGAHHRGRLFAAYGHTVKLMAPKLVAPYRMSGKRGTPARQLMQLMGVGQTTATAIVAMVGYGPEGRHRCGGQRSD